MYSTTQKDTAEDVRGEKKSGYKSAVELSDILITKCVVFIKFLVFIV